MQIWKIEILIFQTTHAALIHLDKTQLAGVLEPNIA